jgi:hypothetical protein
MVIVIWPVRSLFGPYGQTARSRSLNNRSLGREESRAHYGLDKVWNDAVRILEACPEFEAYFHVVLNDTPIKTVPKGSALWPGSLTPVRGIHEKIMTISGRHDRTFS